FSWPPSESVGALVSSAARSSRCQLPYVPRHSASATGHLSWRRWALTYKWCHYSERFTMSSGDHTLTGRLPAYYMNNLILEKGIALGRRLDLQMKLAVNNLFNEDYLSVLSRPMPGINFEFFVALTLL
ncbi:MAG: TonB-dependent receptor, partial [Muribaculaceae bacterium]|nr:TonB-dependent receptor [Muribaculaceae bacterium]